MLNKKALAASLSAKETDADFKQTVLLLHGDGTNGAQNNTFTDSSTNAFTITRNGNTTQGTFSPFSQTGWSNYFDGTGDYLSTSQSQTVPATGDFTIDGWFWCNDYANYPSIFAQGTSGNSGRLLVYINNDGKLGFAIGSSAVTAGSAITKHQWNHFAITRTGSSITYYLNGSSIGTATNSATVQNTTPLIGSDWNGDPYRWVGYLSNIRVSNTVRTISLPTSAFVSDANTVLLTCQSNRFIDTSSTAATLTAYGNVSVQAFSPFAPTDAYSAGTNGGSGYFDGTGDYLETTSTSEFNFGTGDFTIEFWVYPTVTQTAYAGVAVQGTDSDPSWFIQYDANGAKLRLTTWNDNILVSATSIPVNTWTHIAIVRNGGGTNNCKMYLNGVQDVQGTFTNTIGQTSTLVVGGGYAGGGRPKFQGYLSDFRIIKGTAQYTSGFTPPTAPLTAVTNTKFLTNFTNAGIIDQTGKNNLETVGNAQIDTATKKFGTGSLEFDGTGDYLKSPNSPNYNFGSGDFTIEFWMYTADVTPSVAAWFVAMFQSSSGQNSWGVRLETDGSLVGYLSSDGGESPTTITASTPGLSDNTWHHIAFVRNGSGSNNMTLYVDGTSKVTGTFSSALFNSNLPVTVGIQNNTSFNQYFNGFIDDLRITKGKARYTANFTAPTKAFADQ